MLEKFCWNSKIQSIWKSKPDLFDNTITHIHSEAAVFDAIIHSKNAHLPSFENIAQTIYFLEQNTFWRTNPFSLFTNSNDPHLAKAVKKLQMQTIRDIWQQNGLAQCSLPNFIPNIQPTKIPQTFLAENSTMASRVDFRKFPTSDCISNMYDQRDYNHCGMQNTLFLMRADKFMEASYSAQNRRMAQLKDSRMINQLYPQISREPMSAFRGMIRQN